MADHHSSDTETISEHMDYAQHEATYNGFLTAVKWTIVALAISTVILYFLINP